MEQNELLQEIQRLLSVKTRTKIGTMSFSELRSVLGIGEGKLREILRRCVQEGSVVCSFEKRANLVGRVYDCPVYGIGKIKKGKQ